MKIMIIVYEDKDGGFVATPFDPVDVQMQCLTAFALDKEGAIKGCEAMVLDYLEEYGVENLSRLEVDYKQAEIRISDLEQVKKDIAEYERKNHGF